MSDLDFTNKYNTQLPPEKEQAFLQWATANNKLKDAYDYDIRGAWQAITSGRMKQDKRGHLGDLYKKPNHPTFSNQSIYHGVDGFIGGEWQKAKDGTYTYIAPQNHLWDSLSLADYFAKEEPNNKLIYPIKQPEVYESPFYVDPFSGGY